MKDIKSRIKTEELIYTGHKESDLIDGDEFIGYGELFRQVMTEQWGPILDIPIRKSGFYSKPIIEEDGYLDWGAFGTVDFDKMFPFNKSLYKADKLREELTNTLIMFDLIKERLSVKDRIDVIQYVYSGKDIDMIDNWDKWRMACWFSRVRSLRTKIKQCYSKPYKRYNL